MRDPSPRDRGEPNPSLDPSSLDRGQLEPAIDPCPLDRGEPELALDPSPQDRGQPHPPLASARSPTPIPCPDQRRHYRPTERAQSRRQPRAPSTPGRRPQGHLVGSGLVLAAAQPVGSGPRKVPLAEWKPRARPRAPRTCPSTAAPNRWAAACPYGSSLVCTNPGRAAPGALEPAAACEIANARSAAASTSAMGRHGCRRHAHARSWRRMNRGALR